MSASKSDLILLGASGSIGTQVLSVVDHLQNARLVAISIGKNIARCEEIIVKYHPLFVCVEQEEDATLLQKKYPTIQFGWGEEGLLAAASFQEDGGLFVNALVGMVGLKPTLRAIAKKRTILLANKETLVVAGEIVMRQAKEAGVALIPIDSEHSAILQCLGNHPHHEVKRLIITASGGALRHLTRDQLTTVTIEDVLKHPNWSMGKKITVDSATMVNKGLEVMEAHHLFQIPYDQITAILHPESIVHSLVEFKDHSILAQMANPDMRIPIQYAMTYPKHVESSVSQALDLTALHQLTFQPMDLKRYPCLALAFEVGRAGGVLPAVYNASNEAAVALFLNHQIDFLTIETIIFDAVAQTANCLNPTIEDLITISEQTKATIFQKYSQL
jgi:1-deoxy-D-xylulose-5-phosphate reductoisomerase